MTKIGEHKHCVKCNAVIPPEYKPRPLTDLETDVCYFLDAWPQAEFGPMCGKCWDKRVCKVVHDAIVAARDGMERVKCERYVSGWKDGYDRKAVVPGTYPRCPLCDEFLDGRKCPKCGRNFKR